MAFCMAIILFVIGYILIHTNEDPRKTQQRDIASEMSKHSPQLWKEFLLVYGVYAYYLKQGADARPHPLEDAVRHSRLEMLRTGHHCSWETTKEVVTTKMVRGQIRSDRSTKTDHGWLYRTYPDLSQHDMELLSNPEFYWKIDEHGQICQAYEFYDTSPWAHPLVDTTFPWVQGAPFHPVFKDENEKWRYYYQWPFPDGIYKSVWINKTISRLDSTQRTDMNLCLYCKLFNRAVEWYYLVMFKAEFLKSGADIHNALVDEHAFKKEYFSESYIDEQWAVILSEIQGIVYWGDKWDAEIHAYQRQEAARQESERRAAEAPGEERRRKLLEQGANSFPAQPNLPTIDEMTPEWAKQQLKEKYGIDYDAEDSR